MPVEIGWWPVSPKTQNQERPIQIVPDASDAQRIIFIHVAKTAGTSLVQFFRQRLGPGQVLSHGDFLSHCQSEPLPPDLVEKSRLISGHFGYNQVRDYLDEAYSLTFLRNPMDRILSFFRFCQHEDMQQNFAVARAARDLGLEGFMRSELPEVVEMVDNQQTWQLARMYWKADRDALSHLPPDELLAMAKEHIQNLSYVGLTETFATDFERILQDLGIDESVSVPHKNQTIDPVEEHQLSASTREHLRSRLELDFRLYEFVRSERERLA